MAKFISDAEMESLEASQPHGAPRSPRAPSGRKFISDQQMAQLESNQPGMLERAGKFLLEDVAVPVGRAIDRYTGAPSRAALSAGISGENPFSAFFDQFGDEPEKAPTGKQIAQGLGVGDTSLSEVVPGLYSETGEGWKLQRGGILDPTASGAAGLGLDVASDWTNLVPGALALKGAAKAGGQAAGAAAKAVVKGTAKAADVATGTSAATRAVETAGAVGDRAAQVVQQLFRPTQAPTFQQAVAVARKHGIDPSALNSSIEFGKNSFIARAERGLREGPTGEKLLEDYSRGYAQISDAVDRQVSKISGGQAASPIEAGEFIQRGLKKAQDDLLDGVDITYKSVQQYAPGLRVNRAEAEKFSKSLNGVEKYAKGLVSRGVTSQQKAEGRALLQAVNSARAANGSFKQATETLQMLGKAAFKDKPVIGQVSPDVKKLRDLYFDLSDALVNTVKKDVSPDFAKELVDNNQKLSAFFKDRKLVSAALNPDRAGEQIFRQFVVNGDSKKIATLKRRLPPEDVNVLKGAFLQSLIKRTDDGLVNFGALSNSLRQRAPQVAALFEPKEIADLAEIVKLGQDYGPAILSTSGTGASNRFSDLAKKALTGFADERVVERMKASARSRTAGQALPSSVGSGPVVPSITLDTDKLRRGPVERRLKAAQSAAPSSYEGRGPDRWARTGLQKLGISGARADRLLANPKTKKLLIEASDLSPGSPRLKKIKEQIQGGIK